VAAAIGNEIMKWHRRRRKHRRGGGSGIENGGVMANRHGSGGEISIAALISRWHRENGVEVSISESKR